MQVSEHIFPLGFVAKAQYISHKSEPKKKGSVTYSTDQQKKLARYHFISRFT